MSNKFNRPANIALVRGGQLLALTVVATLGACTVQERVYVPPPRAYAPPPPPAPEVDVGVEVTATEAPPPLPEYEQPPCPEDGYLWTPGYWNYGPAGYYWVPGTWVQPPRVGVLWTPGYWGFSGGVYGFHRGYWGPHIGFYGGVNYGFGYGGVGFAGGRWDGGHFAYNTAVNNVNVTVIHNTYNQTVINNNVTVNNRVSFNGGAGGIRATPTAQELAFAHEQHTPPTPAQVQHRQEAARNPALAARANGGHPAIAATPRPGTFSGPGVVGARNAGSPPAMMNHSPPADAAHAPANQAAHANMARPPVPMGAVKQMPKPQAPKSQGPKPQGPKPQQKHPQEPHKEGDRPL